MINVIVGYRSGNKSSTIIGKILQEPDPEATRIWGKRIGLHVEHEGEFYLHLDEAFKIQETIDGVPQVVDVNDIKPMDLKFRNIVGTSIL